MDRFRFFAGVYTAKRLVYYWDSYSERYTYHVSNSVEKFCRSIYIKGLPTIYTLTGFTFIGERINEFEQLKNIHSNLAMKKTMVI